MQKSFLNELGKASCLIGLPLMSLAYIILSTVNIALNGMITWSLALMLLELVILLAGIKYFTIVYYDHNRQKRGRRS